MTQNYRIRFMTENLVTTSNITATTEDSDYPIENLVNDFRFKLYRPTNMLVQRITVNLGHPLTVGFVSLLGPLGEPFAISQGATFKIEANNIDAWSNPPLSLTMTWSDLGGFRFLDDQTDSTYAYWSFYFNDPDAVVGSLSHIYIGEYKTLTFSNLARGFQKSNIDPSIRAEAESGALYYRSRTKYVQFDNMNLQFLTAADKAELEQMAFDKGTSKPFYVSLDPTLLASDSLDELTRYVVFNSPPVFVHARADRYSMTGLSLREVE